MLKLVFHKFATPFYELLKWNVELRLASQLINIKIGRENEGGNKKLFTLRINSENYQKQMLGIMRFAVNTYLNHYKLIIWAGQKS